MYAQARYLDPTLGRFLSADPFPGVLDEPFSTQGFIYGRANPLSYVDPTGRRDEAAYRACLDAKASEYSAKFRARGLGNVFPDEEQRAGFKAECLAATATFFDEPGRNLVALGAQGLSALGAAFSSVTSAVDRFLSPVFDPVQEMAGNEGRAFGVQLGAGLAPSGFEGAHAAAMDGAARGQHIIGGVAEAPVKVAKVGTREGIISGMFAAVTGAIVAAERGLLQSVEGLLSSVRKGGDDALAAATTAQRAEADSLLEEAGRIVDRRGRLPALRRAYEDEVHALRGRWQDLKAAGATPEEIARTLHADRRALGFKYKNLTPPDKLAEIYARNEQKYGDKLGPTIEYLRGEKRRSWDEIAESAVRVGGRDLGF